jgi:hypothetical protein
MQKILTPLALALGLSTAALAEQSSTLLVYKVWEQGMGSYTSRVLVTPRFVRLDEGEGTLDYTLFDREQDIIYNISSEDRTALVMNPPVSEAEPPKDLVLDQRVAADPAAPKIAGHAPQNVTLLANGQVCREMVTVPGLLPEAMDGLRDLQRIVARVQAATLSIVPADMVTPCELADDVHAALRPLDHGLPIKERTERRSRSLVDFNPAYVVADDVLEIPAGYARVPMPGL